MRPEKEFLVTEVGTYLDSSTYALLVEYTRLTVAEVAALRKRLNPLGAKFHVIKSSILDQAAKKRNITELGPVLKGQIAVVVGGEDVASIVKAVEAFFKEKDKGAMKGALLSGQIIPLNRMAELRTLPTMAEARAQLLALLNTPATTFVRILGAPSQQFVNVVEAFVRKNGAAA
jgi:large subunit ribosomal protein L10